MMSACHFHFQQICPHAPKHVSSLVAHAGAVSGLHMVHAFRLAGFPPGLIQCITGKGSEIGDHMTTHPGADCISFTGGTTGISISQKAGMVPLQMELGGKDVCIVCPDADLELAAKSIVSGGLSFQGQRCTAVKVVLVHEAIADELVSKVHKRVSALTVGKPEDNCDICAVISESSANWIETLVMGASPLSTHSGQTPCGKPQ
jgi:glyceraldehyde-3-phosphate dehydrogenase (NADP+)